jgi:hypothetical protein
MRNFGDRAKIERVPPTEAPLCAAPVGSGGPELTRQRAPVPSGDKRW